MSEIEQFLDLSEVCKKTGKEVTISADAIICLAKEIKDRQEVANDTINMWGDACTEALRRARELRTLLDKYPEWSIFGTSDTPRCLICLGRKNYDGHKTSCLRQRVLR